MNTLDPPKNQNYAAVIYRVPAVVDLPKRDRIVGVPTLGHQAIAQKGIEVGDLRVAFTAETQLSIEYAALNNLHRDSTLNADKDAEPGYFEPNRRVKAIKFAGNRSDAVLMPLESLAYTGIDITQLREGDTFDTLNGHEICWKYVNPRQAREASAKGNQPKKQRSVDELMFPQHTDTASLWRAEHLLNDDDQVVVTQKLHGTSWRGSSTWMTRKLTRRDKFAKWFGAKVQELEIGPAYGSRRVIKQVGDPDQNHYYAVDLWSKFGQEMTGTIPQGFIVYGELIGWTPDGAPIQKGYTYRIPQGENRMYVYRVTHINPQGLNIDLTWDQMVDFCAQQGFETVPLLWRGRYGDLDVDAYMDMRYRDEGSPNALPLDPNGTVDEGIVIRREGYPQPLFLKAKSQVFLRHETKLLNEGVEDVEDAA